MTLEEAQATKLGFSNCRHMKTKRKAMAHASAMGVGFSVVQLDPHCGWRRKLGKGTWLIQEWEVIVKR